MGTGLKGLWGVEHPAPADTGEDATRLKAAFEPKIAAINEDLRVLATCAEAAQGQPLAARRDALYLAYQAAVAPADPGPSEGPTPSADQVLADAGALAAETSAARAAAQKALQAWQARQAAYDEAVRALEALEAGEDPRAAALRAQADAIRGDVDARRFDAACSQLDALQAGLASTASGTREGNASASGTPPAGATGTPATPGAGATATQAAPGAGAAAALPAVAATPSAADEQAFVAGLIAAGTRDENALTDQVFHRRHPELGGQRIAAGSDGAQEWVRIRNTIVRPALAAPPKEAPVAAPAPPAGNPAAAESAEAAVPAEEPTLVESAMSAGGALVDAIENAAEQAWDWLTGGDAPPADGGAAAPEQPAAGAGPSAPAQETPDAPAGEVDSAAFESQLDNDFFGEAGVGETTKDKANVKPENECNVTSLSMQLQTLAGDKAAVRQAVCDLLEQQYGQSVSAEDRGDGTQIEDLLLRRFFLPDWASGKKWREVSDAGTKPFYKGWYQEMEANPDFTQVREKKFHQIVYCMQYVAKELSRWIPVGETVAGGGTGPDTFAALKKVIDEGGSVQLGTKLTGGHVVLLVDVLGDGIVINDPYGLALKAGSKNYILNGASRETAEAKLAAVDPDRALLATRTRLRSDLARALAEGATDPLPPNPGEHVFFTFEEAASWQIGKWNSQMTKAA